MIGEIQSIDPVTGVATIVVFLPAPAGLSAQKELKIFDTDAEVIALFKYANRLCRQTQFI